MRGVATRAGRLHPRRRVGIIPLLLYNHYAFHSWTHLAYSDVPRQHKGFFGIDAPSLKVLSTLLFDSRGLLTISPVLIMGAIGTVLLYRRGRRAEALTIGGICLCYLTYNSGYYLPFGGGFMGPRFLTTMIPFLACPLGLALKRFPGPTVDARRGLDRADGDRHDHPPAGGLRDRDRRVGAVPLPGAAAAHDRLRLRPRARAGAASGCSCCRPPPAWCSRPSATRRVRLTAAGAGWGVLALLGWALFAALAPRLLGIDHAGLESIVKAGDHTALNTAQPGRAYSAYPLDKLVPIGAVAGLLALGAFGLMRNQPRRPRRARSPGVAAPHRARAQRLEPSSSAR